MQTDTDTIVYRLAAGCDLSDVEEGKIYLGKVQGFATFGMFVQLNDRIKGLVHKTSIKPITRRKTVSLYGSGRFALTGTSILKSS